MEYTEKDSPSGEKSDNKRNFEVAKSPRRSQRPVTRMRKEHNTPRSQQLNTPRSKRQNTPRGQKQNTPKTPDCGGINSQSTSTPEMFELYFHNN